VYLAQGDDSFLGTHTAAADHDKVLVHLSVVWKSSQRSDGLLRRVVVRRRVVLHHLPVLHVNALTTQHTTVHMTFPRPKWVGKYWKIMQYIPKNSDISSIFAIYFCGFLPSVF